MMPLSHRSILIIQLRAIGDVILTTPAMRVLKKHFPDAAIDFVTNPAPAEILQGNPHLRRVIIYPYKPGDVFGAIRFSWALRKSRYDVVIDYLGTTATALMSRISGAPIRVGYNLRYRRLAYTHVEQGYREGAYNALTKFSLLKSLGIEGEEAETEIFIPDNAKVWADEFCRENKLESRKIAALAPAAKRPARQWTADGFIEVGKWLVNQGYTVILLWGPGEAEYVRNISGQIGVQALLSPQTNLMQCAAILEKCRLLICNCGGTKHLAVATGTPTLTIHGPTDPRVWTPSFDNRHAFITADIDCLNCGKRECDDLKCMERVTAEQVIDKIIEMGAMS